MPRKSDPCRAARIIAAAAPQPHNEGNFTSLGRIARGMEAVKKFDLGDKITAARVK